jgi:hypothetical protein
MMSFLLRYQMAKEANGYEFIYLEENNEIVALLGYRVVSRFSSRQAFIY